MNTHSISYYRGNEFAYTDAHTYSNAQNALVRAVCHIVNAEVDGAAIIYQGRKQQRREFTLKIWKEQAK